MRTSACQLAVKTNVSHPSLAVVWILSFLTIAKMKVDAEETKQSVFQPKFVRLASRIAQTILVYLVKVYTTFVLKLQTVA